MPSEEKRRYNKLRNLKTRKDRIGYKATMRAWRRMHAEHGMYALWKEKPELTEKRLRYEERYTIAGAKQRLRESTDDDSAKELLQEVVDELKDLRKRLD